MTKVKSSYIDWNELMILSIENPAKFRALLKKLLHAKC